MYQSLVNQAAQYQQIVQFWNNRTGPKSLKWQNWNLAAGLNRRGSEGKRAIWVLSGHIWENGLCVNHSYPKQQIIRFFRKTQFEFFCRHFDQWIQIFEYERVILR